MPAGVSVLAGMAIGRGVAAQRGAALLAGAQMDPLRAQLDALLALATLWMFHVVNCADVGAGGGHAYERIISSLSKKA